MRLRSIGNGVLALGALCAAVLWGPWSTPPADPAPPAVVPAAPAGGGSASAAAPVVHAAVPAEPAVPAACPHQHLDIVAGDRSTRSCVTATRTHQRGSLRSYRLDPEGLSTWQLVVEVADAKVFAVRLSEPGRSPRRGAFGCERGSCRGAQIGRPDAHGVRRLTIDGLALSKAGETVRVSSVFTLPRDEQVPGLACASPALRIVENDGALTEFCALGGAGFELADDGRPRFQFRSLEGRSVTVALSADGSVEGVTVGRWACRGAQCSGLSMRVRGDAADPSSERHFSFSGLAVFDPASQRPMARLSGELVMPAQ